MNRFDVLVRSLAGEPLPHQQVPRGTVYRPLDNATGRRVHECERCRRLTLHALCSKHRSKQ